MARNPIQNEPQSPGAPRAMKAAKALPGDREVCPRCGRLNARIIGRSESFPVVYLRCDGCSNTSVAPA